MAYDGSTLGIAPPTLPSTPSTGLPYAGLSLALAQTFNPEIVRQWNRRVQLANVIPVKEGKAGGIGMNVGWDVEFSGATANSFGEGLDVQSGEMSNDVAQKAILPWGQYRSIFGVTNLEHFVSAINQGNADALQDIVGERFLGGMTKILDMVEYDLFHGTGVRTGPDGQAAPSIIGLDTALQATGTYAGLNRATYSEWASNVNSNGGTPRNLALSLLSLAEQQIFNSFGEHPDLPITTGAVHTKYESMLTPTVRTVNDGSAPIRAYQGSTRTLNWRGEGVVRARQATPGTVYLLNSDNVDIQVLPLVKAPDGVDMERRQAIDSNGQDMGASPIPFICYPLGRLGSAFRFMIEVYIQLRVKRPNAHARLTDISES